MELGQNTISSEVLTLGNHSIELPKYHFKFSKSLNSVIDNYGGKAIIDHYGEHLFAELVMVRRLEKFGYTAFWIDTFKRRFLRDMPSITNVQPDLEIMNIHNKIYEAKGGRASGCFDIIARKGDDVLFVELKRYKKDAIRQTQIEWLIAAISIGFTPNNFIIAEWDAF